ncbi:MAG: bifunctional folylpolyglutamate synthase/dihydrofolate synthase [Clostridiales bacterium]|jgi:dihydrofolate synthase/folylpolyglutamate synthase|nr:bifunctional folylpolyglutamate synthase/dihydrofolate synthase [Clostridiales bacterium]
MTYEQAVKKINSLLRFGMKPGLERVQTLLEKMGNPQDRLTFIHVAGTNGKGTTCTLISSVLTQAGYRTGLFTSPYVTEFRERFQINGTMIERETLAALLDEIFPLVEEMADNGEVITEFELITALALEWFARQRCDFVVLEVGLGGRFDATNVIACPAVSVIASISLDHTAVLGDTVEQIAFEKAGILKPGGVTVVYPHQQPGVWRVLEQVSRERDNRLIRAETDAVQCKRAGITGSVLDYRGLELTLPFVGEHQVINACTALTVIEALKEQGAAVTDLALQMGFSKAVLPARMELLSDCPAVLLDGGHNPEGAAALAGVIRSYLKEKRIVAIMGMMADKDSRAALAEIAPLCEEILTLSPENPRSLSSQELAQVALEFCPRVTAMENREQAFLQALKQAGTEGAVLICGSFFLAGEMRPIVQKILKQRQK